MDEKTLTIQLEGQAPPPPLKVPLKEILLISGGAILILAVYISVKK